MQDNDKEFELALLKYYAAKSKANTESLHMLMIVAGVLAAGAVASAVYFAFCIR